jgi:putative aminopeptidase FrvX
MNKEQEVVALLQALVQQASISGSEGGVTRVAADNLRSWVLMRYCMMKPAM